MAAVFSLPYSKTVYNMKQDGLHIFIVYSRAIVYLLAWIAFFIAAMTFFGFKGLNAYSNLTSGIFAMMPSFIVSIILTIVILSFGVFRLRSIQRLFHKEKLVPWNLIEKAELEMVGWKDRQMKAKFFLQPNNELSVKDNKIEFLIRKGSEGDIERFLSAILSERLIIKNP